MRVLEKKELTLAGYVCTGICRRKEKRKARIDLLVAKDLGDRIVEEIQRTERGIVIGATSEN